MTLQAYQALWDQNLVNDYPKDEIRSLLLIALAHRFNWSAIDLVTRKEVEVSENDLNWLNTVLERLKKMEPMQHIIGYTWFCDQKFLVNNAVLIPRPETEELVMHLSQSLQKNEIINALDIGTGSGCIALSLAHVMPQTNWHAWDVSLEALSLAQKNQQHFDIQVNWQRQDVFETWPDQKFDLIVSNPPYIPHDEQKIMDKNVLEYEPHLALFVPSKDPLKFYKAIINKSFKQLNQNGQLYFECHYRYTQDVAQLMTDWGFTQVNSWKDLWGKWRFVSGVRP